MARRLRAAAPWAARCFRAARRMSASIARRCRARLPRTGPVAPASAAVVPRFAGVRPDAGPTDRASDRTPVSDVVMRRACHSERPPPREK